MVIYLEACHSGSMLDQLSESAVFAVSSCRPDEYTYACFFDKKRNTFLSDIFSFNWLRHTDTVKLSKMSFGEQFSYLKEHVSEDARKAGVTETPCCYGDKGMLKLKLSEFLGDGPESVGEAVCTPDVLVCDVVETTEVPLIVQENKIKNEQEPEKRQALQRQYDHLKKKRKTMDEMLQKIAELTNSPEALREKREVTRTYQLKVVAEHFRKNLFNWEEEPFVVTSSHLQVLVNLCESGLQVESITEAITHVSQEMTF